MSKTSLFVRAWLLIALADGLFSSILNVAAYHSTVARLWQGVASVPLGAGALEVGLRTVLIGIALHVCVAFVWTALFLLAVSSSTALQEMLQTTAGIIAVACVYGPFVWVAMSFGVVPLFTHRLPPVAFRWWVQFVGHAPFVGLPIVSTIARGFRHP